MPQYHCLSHHGALRRMTHESRFLPSSLFPCSPKLRKCLVSPEMACPYQLAANHQALKTERLMVGDSRLATPRLHRPRRRVEAGGVCYLQRDNQKCLRALEVITGEGHTVPPD